jgi:type IV pilus assembly protein PilA
LHLANLEERRKKAMKKFLKSFQYGKKGFTLIELLVVVAILGVLAAIVVPNVGKFIGEGTTQAKATEFQNVQTAVTALLAANPADAGTFAGGSLSKGDSGSGITCGTDNLGNYLTGNVEYGYTIGSDGTVTQN